MLHKKIIFLLLTIGLFLTGCNAPVYNQTENNVADVVLRTNAARQQSNAQGRPIPSMVINQGSYVDKTPINLAKDPAWLKNRIIMRGDNLPFSYYSRTIVGGSNRNVLTHYQVGLDPSAQVSLNYSGTVRGALDLLAAKTGYVYSVNGNSVYWQAFITKTFEVAFMPGASDYLMGGEAGGSLTGSGGGSSSAGGGPSTTVTGMVNDTASSQYSNLKAKLSIWDDLKSTISQLLSADGKVVVSQASTSVTVRDRPTNVALIDKYIQNLNKNLSKQVLVKVQVLDIQLSSDFNFGINWDAVKHTLGHQFQLIGNYGTPITLTPFSVTPGASGFPQIGINNIDGHSTGVTALISALQQQGKVSVVTEPRVVCINNNVSEIRIVNELGYLASIQNTTVAGASGGGSAGTITSQITPGLLVTGLTLYILPKILGDKVYLQVNADLTSNNGFKNISSVPSGSTNPNASQIQVPNVSIKSFNQRSVISSGATLILSGFKQVINQANAMQLFDSQALGGKGSQQQNAETIVLITPIILPGYV